MHDLEYEGPPEPDWFDCGYCGKPILTLWSPNYRGMVSNEDSCLLGDQVWHNTCLEECLKENPVADWICG